MIYLIWCYTYDFGKKLFSNQPVKIVQLLLFYCCFSFVSLFQLIFCFLNLFDKSEMRLSRK